jgi:hypothetical protein
VGSRKPLYKQLGGLEQFDLFFWASVLGHWENSLMVLSVVLLDGL